MDPENFEESMSKKRESCDGIQQISTFRRVTPQVLAIFAKNFVVMNMGQFFALPSIVIPSLVGLSAALNPDETIHVTAEQTSWLSSFAHIAHPIGSMMSGPICDKFGRRKTFRIVSVPLFAGWILLGYAHSFPIICFGFLLLGFCLGVKDAPAVTYCCEISETKFRSMLMSLATMAVNFGTFIVLGCGSVLSWRQVAFVSAISPVCCFISMFFVPESPTWLLSKDRPKDAQKSLQWLRGWVSPRIIQQEFNELQNFSNASNACVACANASIKCYHSKPTFSDKIKEIKRKRTLKAGILVLFVHLLNEFALTNVWQPYIIQVLYALGTPINANLVTVLTSISSLVAGLLLISIIKTLGKRKVYLTSILVVTICSFGIYGFVFFPPGWKSFKTDASNHAIDSKIIRNIVGNYSYLGLLLIFIGHFSVKVGVYGLISTFSSEVFPSKSRAIFYGIATGGRYIFASIATKTYYNIEMWLSLPGSALFYGLISAAGFVVMFLIMPETEQCSLEDIERHYSDNSKSLFDIYIQKKATNLEYFKSQQIESGIMNSNTEMNSQTKTDSENNFNTLK